LLAWGLGRADFAAVSLPWFHVFWAMLIVSVVAERDARWARVAWLWPVAMSVVCVLNGAHAVLDVAASWLIWQVITWAVNPFWCLFNKMKR
jgi:hypothetical protein